MATQDGTIRGSRDRILIAAAEMIGDDPAARLSVRAVAARAGVSTGSLRFHFPTQRDLHDAVLAGIFAHVAPDDQIHDSALPARDRLVGCLRQVVDLMGADEQARANWKLIFESFMAEAPTSDARDSYLAIARQGDLRLEHWLGVLAREGALPAERIPSSTRFLSTVLDGLAIGRALPAAGSRLSRETEALYMAVDAVLQPRG